ncbi:hypothetical protein NMY22_g13216 [Coprinellus aureogranulatus]|nr:hypothetical protein NMY22_g13216 [Coprinellus aureogranulatus]
MAPAVRRQIDPSRWERSELLTARIPPPDLENSNSGPATIESKRSPVGGTTDSRAGLRSAPTAILMPLRCLVHLQCHSGLRFCGGGVSGDGRNLWRGMLLSMESQVAGNQAGNGFERPELRRIAAPQLQGKQARYGGVG